MESSFLGWCSAHFPHITIVALLVIASVIITWRISKAYIHWTSRVKTNEQHGTRIDNDILPRLTNIDQSINKLIVYLKTKHNDMDSQLFTVNSPLVLSQIGKELLEKCGGKKYIDEHKDSLIAHMNDMGVQTALDSQKFARYVILENSSNENFKPIKDFIFNNPKLRPKGENPVEIDVDLENVAGVMGVYLRDKYLETRQDLNAEDIP